MTMSLFRKQLISAVVLGLFAFPFFCNNSVIAKTQIDNNIQIVRDEDEFPSEKITHKFVDIVDSLDNSSESVTILGGNSSSSDKHTVRVGFDREVALNYLLNYFVVFGGEGYHGEKKVLEIKPDSEFIVDEINGPFSGANARMYWFSKTHHKWFGETSSDIEIKVDQEDNIWRRGDIVSSFETYDAKASMEMEVIGKGNVRSADGSIYYELSDAASFDGTVYSSVNLDIDGHRVGNYGLRANSDMGRYEIFINYKTIDNQVEATYSVDDCLYFNTTEGTLSYSSDEPNMVHDLDEIARSLYK